MESYLAPFTCPTNGKCVKSAHLMAIKMELPQWRSVKRISVLDLSRCSRCIFKNLTEIRLKILQELL